MPNCNQDILAQARCNVADRNNPAHRSAIMAGEWDQWALIQAEITRLLREPVIEQGDE